jgi:hypothetical protein
VFRLSSGSADVQSETPTEVGLGEATLGSRRTQYVVRVERTRRSAAPTRVLVFEGDVTVRTAGGEERPVTTGGGVAVRGGQLGVTELEVEDVKRTAMAFAQLDVAQARLTPAAAREARAVLEREYTAVLTAPTDSRQRLALAATQLAVGVTPTATLYQLNRAAPAGADPAGKAAVGYLTGVAYSRAGDSARATREFQAAARLDSASVERLIRQYNRLESPAYRTILRTRLIRERPARDSAPSEPAGR